MMGENGLRWENMENINQMTKNTPFMIQNTRFMTQKKTLFDQKTQNTFFYGYYVAGRTNHKIHARRTSSWVGSKWDNIKRNVEPSYSHQYNDKNEKISPQKSQRFLVAFFLHLSHYHQHGSLFSVVVVDRDFLQCAEFAYFALNKGKLRGFGG